MDCLCQLEKKVLCNLKQTQQKKWGYCRVDEGVGSVNNRKEERGERYEVSG